MLLLSSYLFLSHTGHVQEYIVLPFVKWCTCIVQMGNVVKTNL